MREDGGGACDPFATMAPDELHALLAAGTAGVVTAARPPVGGRVSARFGLLDEPRERGLSERMTPLLGGVAIFVGVLVAALVFLPIDATYRSILAGALVITIVGAIDDVLDLNPAVKLAGQVGAVALPVSNGVTVPNFTLPVGHRRDPPHVGAR